MLLPLAPEEQEKERQLAVVLIGGCRRRLSKSSRTLSTSSAEGVATPHYLLTISMGTLTRIAINAFIAFLAVAAGFYQIYLKPVLAQFGISPARVIQPLGIENCKGIPELKACEGASVLLSILQPV
jgi:hypothetical protein